MKKRTIILLLLVCPMFTFAQVSKERDVIGSSGDHSIAAGIQLSWTVGEVAITTAQNPSLIVTQGFQQIDASTTGLITQKVFEGDIKVFPNPVEDILNFNIQTEDDMELVGELFDASGRKVREISTIQVSSEYTGQLDMSDLPAGKWFLRFSSSKTGTFKSFGIVKVR